METKLIKLKSLLNEVTDLNRAVALLDWDQQTYMPVGGTQGRSHTVSTLSRLAHIRFTSPEVGQLLSDLKPYTIQLDPDSDDACLLKVTTRRYEKRTKVPADWVAEFSQLTTAAHQIWQEARAEANFLKFQDILSKIINLRRQYANFFAPFDHIYDPLLDDFEPGMKTADVKTIFTALRPQQVELIQAIKDRPQVDDSFLYQPYDERLQWDFGVEVISKFGYDWNRGRQDKSAHPFTTDFGSGDVRITTRVNPNYLGSALFGTMHECGHALYDQGIETRFDRTPLARGASLGFHESQSRTFENLVGRSYDFWLYFYPSLQARFKTQLGNVDVETFYKGINRVQPSMIRVEADEATYNLHIMLRLELEISLLDGSLAVQDLPEAWNNRMQAYLGITPPNDTLGVLQDVHWSGGMLGYFSTYALGNLISAQLWERVMIDIPDLSKQIRQGDFSSLVGWMRKKIHQHGAKLEPQELIQRITGSKIDPAPYIRYLHTKFGEIYKL